MSSTTKIVWLLIFWPFICRASDREKRQLLFPPQSIMQLAFAVVTPAQVKNKMITTNMGAMFNIDLPTNISRWYPWRADYRRRRKRSADINQTFYTLLESLLSWNGLDGSACLQKSICQMREMPDESEDLPLQILNSVFGIRQKHLVWESSQRNISCDKAFPTCDQTPVDIFIQLLMSSWSLNKYG